RPLADSQDPPLVYLSRAEADVNQKPPEDFPPFGMFPGPIESAIVVGPTGGFGFGRGWSIVGAERKKPHEAIFLPLEPLDTNDASVLRLTLHQMGGKFKSLIGRFRLRYTRDPRIRRVLLPAHARLGRRSGPSPAEDAGRAHATGFEPEKDIKDGPLDLKKSYDKVVLPPPPPPAPPGAAPAKPGEKPAPPKKEGPPAKK